MTATHIEVMVSISYASLIVQCGSVRLIHLHCKKGCALAILDESLVGF